MFAEYAEIVKRIPFFFLRFKSWIENAKSLLPRQIFYLQKRAPAETVWIENRDIPLQLACGFKKLTGLT